MKTQSYQIVEEFIKEPNTKPLSFGYNLDFDPTTITVKFSLN